MNVFTIGFTRKSAATFFAALKQSGAKRVIDVRLRNTSSLAGFAKCHDLEFFLRALNGMEYLHALELAPTHALLQDYRKSRDWTAYEREFLALMHQRDIQTLMPQALFDEACLLCSEASPQHCHRRLVAEYLQQHRGDVEIIHLL